MTLAVMEKDGQAEISQHAHNTVWSVLIQQNNIEYIIDSLTRINESLKNKLLVDTAQ